MSRPADFDLDADAIVTAAVEIFRESGLDAVSMRSVATRLGVSPVPLYSRIGNKEALIDAIADRLFANLPPPRADDDTWATYATRWAGELRSQLASARESRLVLSLGRDSFVEISRPLVEAMRQDGVPGRRGGASVSLAHVGNDRVRRGRVRGPATTSAEPSTTRRRRGRRRPGGSRRAVRDPYPAPGRRNRPRCRGGALRLCPAVGDDVAEATRR